VTEPARNDEPGFGSDVALENLAVVADLSNDLDCPVLRETRLFAEISCGADQPFDFRLWPREWLGRDAEFFFVVKLSRHHVRHRSTVRRSTPITSVSSRMRSAVAPCRRTAINTTIAAM
jgi:hypothetical protein